jgi:hypothetical protein
MTQNQNSGEMWLNECNHRGLVLIPFLLGGGIRGRFSYCFVEII